MSNLPLFEILTSIIAGAISILGMSIMSSKFMQMLIREFFGSKKKTEKPYSEKLSQLTSNLIKASREVDSVLSELDQVARDRESSVQKLETDLEKLLSREKELKKNIDALENTPLPVAEHFAKLLESREKRSTRRDYVLFGAGVLVTTVIAIIFQLLIG